MNSVGTGWQPQAFVVDVDGVMTTGQMAYTAEGKILKFFGADDHDALLLLKEKLPIQFVSGDRKGFDITRRRIVDDMEFRLDLVSTVDRVAWIAKHWDPARVIYMGDGLLDIVVFTAVGYSICPADGFYLTREKANYVTQHQGGQRAVAEACIHVLQKFFGLDVVTALQALRGGEWGKMSA